MRDLTKARSGIALVLLAAGGLIGCGPMTDRTKCQIGVTGTGAVVGGFGGGVGTFQIAKNVDNGEVAAGAAVGALAGALVGWGLSYLICPEEAPPPPPAPPAPAPRAPAPPQTERRGG